MDPSASLGYVLFIGAALGIADQGHEWRDKLLPFLERYPSSDLQQQPMAAPAWIEAAGPTAPALVTPVNGDILPQPEAGPWLFEWKSVPEAQKYQIIVLGAHAAIPLINTETKSSWLTVPPSGAYIVDQHLCGWTWRVRAQDYNG